MNLNQSPVPVRPLAPLANASDLAAAETIRLAISVILFKADPKKWPQEEIDGDSNSAAASISSAIVRQLEQLPPSISVSSFVRDGFPILSKFDIALESDADKAESALFSKAPESDSESKVLRPSESLANKLIELGMIPVFEHVAAVGTLGVTVTDMCCWRRLGSTMGSVEHRSLAQTAMNTHLSADGLRLALQLYPDTGGVNPDPEDIQSSFPTAADSLAQSHYNIVVRAIFSSDANVIKRCVACAMVFCEQGTPIETDGAYSANLVSSLMLGNTWLPAAEPELNDLLVKYHEMGKLDVNAPLRNSLDSVGGFTPLGASIKLGNSAAAKTLLDLGCNYKDTLIEGKSVDLVSLVKAAQLLDEGKMTSCVVAGLMDRKIKDGLESAAASTTHAPPSAAPRRSQRAQM